MKQGKFAAAVFAASMTLCQAPANAGVLEPLAGSAEPIAGRYIVELSASGGLVGDVLGLAQGLLAGIGGGQLLHVYENALQGFAVELSPVQALLLSLNPQVKRIEPDQVMRAISVQPSATWGLNRIDERDLPMDGNYRYPDAAGLGVHVYVIDTGINASHNEFTGRVAPGRNFVSSGGGLFGGGTVDPGDTNDCNGHGTHVASTAVGTTYGVAKRATVHAVRVLGCNGSGSNSGVIAGVDWVAANAPAGSVANMSLGGSSSTALDNAVNNAIDRGVTMVVAAGNSNANACNGSPNRVPAAITVGATTNADQKASYSNYGACLDIWAPGSSITAARHSNNSGTTVLSGTSMASPHVAGAAALVVGRGHAVSPAQVRELLVGEATNGVLVGNLGSGSPNRLLYVNDAGGGQPPVDNAPVAAFSASCADLGCSFNAAASSDDVGIASYTWNFGDGTSGNGPSVSHTYAAAGHFTVSLTVTDTAGQSDTDSQAVSVTAPDNSTPCADCSVTSGNVGNGQTAYTPSSSGFSSNGGLFEGYLRGPSGSNLDLYLERYSPGFLIFAGSWNVVASAQSAGSDEDIQYSGNAGTYRWRIVSRSGGGNVTFHYKNP